MNYGTNDLKGKVCLVTGGCGVFGRVFSKGLAESGAKVVVMDYKPGRCDTCAQNLMRKEGAEILCVVANVVRKDELLDAREKVRERFGKIDVLINCAGGNSPKATTTDEIMDENNFSDLSRTFFGLDPDAFRNIFDLNILGTILPTMVFAEDMIQRGGSVINISSMNAFRPLTKIAGYSAAKASVNNLTQWLAVHFAKANIRVNAIAPGFFLTGQNEYLLIDAETKELTARGKKIISHTPMGRFGQPEELLGALFYLASSASKFVTGAIIPVDGGFSSYSGV